MLPSITSRTRDIPVVDLFDIFFNDLNWYRPTKAAIKPYSEFSVPVDVEEREGEYLITAEVPGVNKEDIDITLEKNQLTLKINKTEDREESKSKYLYKERKALSFNRTIKLPSNLVNEDIKAHLDQGVLHVIVRKSPESQPKKITIN